ncbi:MAG: class I SAM-dependent methyltransferase [Armatimonadetes bacterium]|nr:class I SAM-dependent methyltransferase [Anaerolineae bacterium]
MPADYAVLASIYDAAGLAAQSAQLTMQAVTFTLQRGWLGRTILDLGCGTGAGMAWMKQQGYRVTGVDLSPDMLNAARQTIGDGRGAPLLEQDIRKLAFTDEFDLVLALNVLNELDSLRELEAVFKGVQQALHSGQLFAFDLFTTEGLAKNGGERLFYDAPERLTVFTRQDFDYERQARTTRYWVFNREPEDGWQRATAEHIHRSYPISAVVTLLQRANFEGITVWSGNFTPYEPGMTGIERVIFMAKKA